MVASLCAFDIDHQQMCMCIISEQTIIFLRTQKQEYMCWQWTFLMQGMHFVRYDNKSRSSCCSSKSLAAGIQTWISLSQVCHHNFWRVCQTVVGDGCTIHQLHG